jgi:hypothetical protein
VMGGLLVVVAGVGVGLGLGLRSRWNRGSMCVASDGRRVCVSRSVCALRSACCDAGSGELAGEEVRRGQIYILILRSDIGMCSPRAILQA